MRWQILLITLLLTVGSSNSHALAYLKVGYLGQAESDLSAIAERTGAFTGEGLSVRRIGFSDAGKGLTALQAGTVDIGIFPVLETLRAIAAGKRLRIIAGGQTPAEISPLNELVGAVAEHGAGSGFVTVIREQRHGLSKPLLVRFTMALISAYHTHRLAVVEQEYSRQISFDPNPGYWRLEKLWHAHSLQKSFMKRDFLASHVFEEVYCDAIDSLLDRSEDPVYKELSAKAVCVPDCCPKDKMKQSNLYQ